jgi:hypothetical protein
MRAMGELRTDVHTDAIRSALNSMFEGMLRDLVLAQRTGFPANYGREDMQRVFKIVLQAFLTPR